MSEAEAKVSEKRGISRIWVIPIVALLIGAYMVFYTWKNQGPRINVSFETAEGIEAGKTKIKTRSVDLGLVETVVLGKDHERVEVTARLEPDTESLLREDTQFWVVRPRVGAAGISGLGTVLSGGYIDMAPGVGKEGRRDFVGIEEPPVTPVGTPGVQIELWGDEDSSVGTSDPIMYKGFEVGRIESTQFDFEKRRTRYRAFINAPYDKLVTTSTRFWNMSGIRFDASAEGVKLRTGSLQTLLIGGVSFGLPTGALPGEPVKNGASFELFPDQESINEHPFTHFVHYVAIFDRSVRGLEPGAPVEFRGLAAGQVERVLLKDVIEGAQTGRQQQRGLPVLLRFEPGRLTLPDSEVGETELKKIVERAVKNGMRATLETGNLLTGSLYVALDLHDDATPTGVGEFQGYPTIPTIGGGLEQIQSQISALLKKLNSLPLDQVARTADATLDSAKATLRELEGTVADLRDLMASEATQGLPSSADATLSEIDATLRSVRDLADTLEKQPNSLIFSREHQPDPEPQAGAR